MGSVLHDVFHTSLASLALASLITNPDIRVEVEAAEQALQGGDLKACGNHSAVAFKVALDLESKRVHQVRGYHWVSHFTLSDVGREFSGDLGRALQAMQDTIDELRDEVGSLFLGLNSRRYLEFLRKTPYVYATLDGKYHSTPRTDEIPSREDALNVFDFVTSTIFEWGV